MPAVPCPPRLEASGEYMPRGRWAESGPGERGTNCSQTPHVQDKPPAPGPAKRRSPRTDLAEETGLVTARPLRQRRRRRTRREGSQQAAGCPRCTEGQRTRRAPTCFPPRAWGRAWQRVTEATLAAGGSAGTGLCKRALAPAAPPPPAPAGWSPKRVDRGELAGLPLWMGSKVSSQNDHSLETFDFSSLP